MKKHIFSIIIFSIIAIFTLTGACFASPVSSAKTKIKNKVASVVTLLPQKDERNNVLKKFFFVMLLVCGSGLVVYVLGSAYKKYRTTSSGNKQITDLDKNLNSPETIEDAVKMFIEKF